MSDLTVIWTDIFQRQQKQSPPILGNVYTLISNPLFLKNMYLFELRI